MAGRELTVGTLGEFNKLGFPSPIDDLLALTSSFLLQNLRHGVPRRGIRRVPDLVARQFPEVLSYTLRAQLRFVGHLTLESG